MGEGASEPRHQGRGPAWLRAPRVLDGDPRSTSLWTLVGHTQCMVGVQAVLTDASPTLPTPSSHLSTQRQICPPSCPMHKSTLCAHGVVLASGTRYLGGGPSGNGVVSGRAGQADGRQGL